jgi:hypothetical protein
MVAGVEHAMPGSGWVVGHGALHRHVSPIMPMPPGKQVQSAAPYTQWTPTLVHAVAFAGAVPGQVPQLHLPITQEQSSLP